MMVKRLKTRARVRRDRIDVTSFDERARGETSFVFGRHWIVSLTDGRQRSYVTWRDAVDYAVRATTWSPLT